MTDFPPPPGFAGYENRPYDDFHEDERYVRACTDEEAAILDADHAADRAAVREEDAALRDRWFDLLKGELVEAPSADEPDARKPLRPDNP